MYTLAIPISMAQLNDKSRPIYLENLKKCNAKRVFLCGQGWIYTPNCAAKNEPEELALNIKYFRDAGLEVGLWIGGFGHGAPLSPTSLEYTEKYTKMEGINGDQPQHAICPLDEEFARDYAEGLKLLASFHPDLIMIDDDYRINQRTRLYYFGCFCPLHMAEYEKRLGEKVDRAKLESLIFTGGKNKYRTTYLELMRDSLINFAKKMREAIDEVDPSIRLGSCTAEDSWDLSGTSPMEIAKAFAGNTKPFSRNSGAPYWVIGWSNKQFLSIIESCRQQCAWNSGSGVELFAEGDTYPRPRYTIPTKLLEVFDLALECDGTGDGILGYMQDYETKPEYEPGYIVRYARSMPKRLAMREIFGEKTAVGVRVFNVLHKVENWDLPNKLAPRLGHHLQKSHASPAGFILSRNSIPTTYADSDYPVLLYGENAKYISEAELANGAILDTVAAEILTKRGIDVGLLSVEAYGTAKALSGTRITSPARELFPEENVSIPNVAASVIKKISCKEGAEIFSTFTIIDTPASYYYENEKGQKFFVLAYDHYAANGIANPHFENNYCRQRQLVKAIERMAGTPLPAKCLGNPDLYILTSKKDGAMAVALFNAHLDDIFEPAIKLDKCYTEIRFVGCSGRLEGDTVYLSDIAPYGSVAFEVK